MEEILARRRKSVMARNALREWGLSLAPSTDLELSGVEPAFAFWHSEDEAMLLPDAAVNGLSTASVIGKLHVHLYTYMPFTNVPPTVTVCDANELMPWNIFKRRLKAVGSIPLLADFMRLLAMEQSPSPANWFLDCDTVVVTDLRGLGRQKDAFDHVFASLEAHPGKVGGEEQDWRFWMRKFLVEPRDRWFIATPMKLPRGSPVLKNVLQNLKDHIYSAQPEDGLPYNTFMDHLAGVMISWGLEAAVLPPSAFSPCPYYAKTIPLQNASMSYTSVPMIMASSYGVNAFWQSSKMGDDRGALARGSDSRAHPCSFWARLLAAVRAKMANDNEAPAHPTKRRRLANKASDPTLPLQNALEWPAPRWEWPQMMSSPAPSAFSQSPIKAQYQLESIIGQGSYGEVYNAKEIRGAGRAAIKISMGKSLMEPLRPTEVIFHARATGPHVVQLLDAWTSPWFCVLVMERMQQDCYTMLSERPQKRISEMTGRVLVGEVAKGLKRLHELYIMHRDLHSKNVLVSHSASSQEDLLETQLIAVKIADFGLASNIENAIMCVSPHSVTIDCCARHITPPEILFAKGTEWRRAEPTSEISAWSQTISVYEITKRPTFCRYTEAIDMWALGQLLYKCTVGTLCNSRIRGELGCAMVHVFGRVPRAIVQLYKWSIPGAWTCQDEAFSKVLHVERNADLLKGLARYDPSARARAAEVVHAIASQPPRLRRCGHIGD